MLFSMFGMTDADALLVKDYGTTMVSVNFMLQFLFASFQWIMLIILLNILIARMSETYSDLSVSLLAWSFTVLLICNLAFHQQYFSLMRLGLGTEIRSS
jgi:hypothetical protein